MAEFFSGRRPPLRLTGLTVAALLAAVGSASAQTTAPALNDRTANKTTQKQQATQPLPAAPGLTIARDAETGALRPPTEAEAAALRSAAPATASEVTEFVTPTGAIAALVPDELHSYTVVSKNADGTLDQICLPDRQSAEAALHKATHAAQAAPAASVVRKVSALRPAPGAPHE